MGTRKLGRQMSSSINEVVKEVVTAATKEANRLPDAEAYALLLWVDVTDRDGNSFYAGFRGGDGGTQYVYNTRKELVADLDEWVLPEYIEETIEQSDPFNDEGREQFTVSVEVGASTFDEGNWGDDYDLFNGTFEGVQA